MPLRATFERPVVTSATRSVGESLIISETQKVEPERRQPDDERELRVVEFTTPEVAASSSTQDRPRGLSSRDLQGAR